MQGMVYTVPMRGNYTMREIRCMPVEAELLQCWVQSKFDVPYIVAVNVVSIEPSELNYLLAILARMRYSYDVSAAALCSWLLIPQRNKRQTMKLHRRLRGPRFRFNIKLFVGGQLDESTEKESKRSLEDEHERRLTPLHDSSSELSCDHFPALEEVIMGLEDRRTSKAGSVGHTRKRKRKQSPGRKSKGRQSSQSHNREHERGDKRYPSDRAPRYGYGT